MKNSDLYRVKLSPHAKSETRYITPIEINLKQLGYGSSKKVILVDSPGSEDTESKEVDISNGFGVINAISQSKSVIPVILISYMKIGPRLEGLKAIITYYSKMIQGGVEIMKKIVFFFT